MAEVSTTSVDVDREKKKRPATLTILTILLFVRVLLVAGGTIAVASGVLLNGEAQFSTEFLAISASLALLVVTIILFVAAWGLWYLKPWAWQLNMILMGFLLLIGIWSHFAQSENRLTSDVTLALNIVTVFYLIQGEVRDLFVGQEGKATST